MAKKNGEYLSRSKKYDENRIRVGRDYQADIPPLRSTDDVVEPMVEDDKLLWQPSKIQESTVGSFLTAIKSSPNPKLDEERALFLLHQCDYDTEEAFRRFQLLPQPSDVGDSWSEEECKIFERILQFYGKKFNQIQKLVPSRSVKDVVEFYYFWKRSRRYDAFINEKYIFGRSRLKKKFRRKVNRTIDPAEVILNKDPLLVDDDRLIYPFFELLGVM